MRSRKSLKEAAVARMAKMNVDCAELSLLAVPAIRFILALFVIVGAKYDLRDRQVPRFSGFTVLILGLVYLLVVKKPLYALFYIAMIFGTQGLKYKSLPVMAALLLLARSGNAAVPFIVSMFTADLFYSLRFLGGGDMQLLFAMLAIGGNSWLMPLLICGMTLIWSIVLSVKRFGIRRLFSRFIKVCGNYRKPEKDTSRIRTPYAVLLAVSMIIYCGVCHLYTAV